MTEINSNLTESNSYCNGTFPQPQYNLHCDGNLSERECNPLRSQAESIALKISWISIKSHILDKSNFATSLENDHRTGKIFVAGCFCLTAAVVVIGYYYSYYKVKGSTEKKDSSKKDNTAALSSSQSCEGTKTDGQLTLMKYDASSCENENFTKIRVAGEKTRAALSEKLRTHQQNLDVQLFQHAKQLNVPTKFLQNNGQIVEFVE